MVPTEIEKGAVLIGSKKELFTVNDTQSSEKIRRNSRTETPTCTRGDRYL